MLTRLAPFFLALAAAATPAAAEGGVNLGILECKVAGGFGYVLGSSRDMTCTFKRSDGSRESYSGAFDRYGLDLGYTDERWLYWGVFAPGDVGKVP
nr:DUF992 domain-containing protein [Dongia mobilis]